MPLTKQDTQVKWSASDSVSVTAGGSQTSDEVAIADNAISAMLHLKADNSGTPASGDRILVKILANCQDPDADPDSADEFATQEVVGTIKVLDTNLVDPALDSIPIPTTLKSFKVYMESEAASNAITVSAQLREQLASDPS